MPPVPKVLLAMMLAACAVSLREALQPVAPGVGQFAMLIPVVVLSGMLWGPLPASVACGFGGGIAAVLFVGPALLAPPPFNSGQINLLLYASACAAVIWAIHALRRSATVAERAEARLAEVFRQVPGAAAILEAPGGRLLLRSSKSGMVLGHPPLEIDRADDIVRYGGIHPDGRPFAPHDYPIARALLTGTTIAGEHIRYRRPDGRVVDLEVHAGPVRDAEGTVLAAVGMAFDITERMEAERRLRASEAEFRAVASRLRAAIDAGGLGLWEIDLAAGITHFDGTMAAMLGMPPEPMSVPRTEMYRFIHPDDHAGAGERLMEAVEAGGPYADERRMLTVDGDVRWVVSRGAVLKDLRRVLGVVSDVTERRERENALHEALAARDVLMREADHRIKNSLQLVASLLSLQMMRSEDAGTKHTLAEAIARVDAIATAHLALERSPDLRTIEIDRMLEELCSRVGKLNPSVSIACEASAGIGLDAQQAIPLGLIASEVLTNALRHAFPPGEAGAVSVRVMRYADEVEVAIADTGSGLPPGARRSGLGSSLIGALARQIGAKVTTASEPGKGVAVTVRVVLPASDDAPLRRRP